MHPHQIKLGTLAGKGAKTADYVAEIQHHGFETYQINFDKGLKDTDLSELAPRLANIGAEISCLGIYGNPLGTEELDQQTRHAWEQLIDHAESFGTNLICGFTGRVSGASIPDSMNRYAEVFGELSKRAADKGVRIAFENCPMGGNWHSGEWNLAHNPAAWELLFNAIPSDNIGLEWEPCHQMCQLIEPMPQIREWGHKFFHIHGKDANVRKDLLQKYGAYGKHYFAEHRHPGFGDCNWTHIISELLLIGFEGSIDIEGWHDPVYKDDQELTGQVHALNYLKSCRPEPIPEPQGY